ncbi:hypothetical protein SNE40_018951 [Patella caerulea]
MTNSYSTHPNAFRGKLRMKSSAPNRRLASYEVYPNTPLTYSALKMVNPELENPKAPANVYGYGKRQYDYQIKESFLKYKYMFEPRPDIKQSALPSRAPMSHNSKIPGRLFQKCPEVLMENSNYESARLSTMSAKLPTRAIVPKDIPVDMLPVRESVSSKLPIRPIRPMSARGNTNTSLYDFSTLESEIYAISFKDNGRSKNYDPDSELHSDYYTIRRLPVRCKKNSVKKDKSVDLSLLLTGERKEIHSRLDDTSDYVSSPEMTPSG